MIYKLILFLEGLKVKWQHKAPAETRTPAMGSAQTEIETILKVAYSGSAHAQSTIHGDDHWRAVAAVGLRLCDLRPKASRPHALLFGLLHDSRRHDDSWDDLHGARAAQVVTEYRSVLEAILSPSQVESLAEACLWHEKGQTSRDQIDIAVAWDADRYNLRRLGYDIRRELLSCQLSDGEHAMILVEVEEIWRDPPDWPELIKEAGL